MFCSCVVSVTFSFFSKLSVVCESVISGALRSAFEVVGIEVFSVFSFVFELVATYVMKIYLSLLVEAILLTAVSFQKR